MDTTVSYQPSQESECSPAIALGASEYLVVWQSGRNTSISATRVTRCGDVLEPHPIWIGWGGSPDVVFDGSNFLVVWNYLGIRCIRIGPSGVLLDTSPIPVCTLAYAQLTPAVARGDSVSLVVWTDARDSADTAVYAARVTRSGTVLDPDGILVAGAIGSQDEPAVAVDGNDWLVVWRDDRVDSAGDIVCARVSAAGIVRDTAEIPICRAAGIQANPTVSFGDSVFLVVWEDSWTGVDRSIRGTRVSMGGELLDSAGFLVSDAVRDQVNPACAFDGVSFLVSWSDFRNNAYSSDIYGARVAQTGSVLDTTGFAVSTTLRSQSLPALVRDDTLCLAVWQDSVNGSGFSPDIYAARVNRAGQVADPHGILVTCGRTAGQGAARAVPTDAGFLVAWEQRSYPTWACFARLGPDGELVDSAPTYVSEYPRWSYAPSLAVADTYSLIVWVGSSHASIMGNRISHTGELLDSAGFSIAGDTLDFDLPATASDGSDWLVLWQQGRTNTLDIFASRVSWEGAVLDSPGIPVCCAARNQTQPRVTFGDSLYLAVWLDNRLPGRTDVYAARINRSGAVLDSGGNPVTFDSSYRGALDIAFGGTNCLAVWQEQADIRGARISLGGTVIDSAPILVAGGSFACGPPSVTFDGTDYVVAWADNRSGTYTGIYGVRVTRWGTVFSPFPVSPPTNAGAPCIVAVPGGGLMAVYESGADSVNHRPFSGNRIWGRLSPFEGVAEEGITHSAQCMTLEVVPNPLGGSGQVRYALPASGHVRLALYDISGRLVQLLAEEQQKAGSHALRWNGTAKDGSSLANGVYILRLDACGRSETRTMTVAR